MIRFLRLVGEIFYEAAGNWLANKGPRLGAALAFYSLLSIAPLLVITIGIAGYVFGESAARRQMLHQVEELVGEEGAKGIASMLASGNRKAGIAASAIGAAMLFVGASGVFGELQDAMNTIWKVKPRPSQAWTGMLRSRFVSFAMVLGTGFLLLVSLAISALISGAEKFLGGRWPSLEPAWHVLNLLVSLGVVAVLFAMIFKFLPDVEIPWRDVWFGAALTGSLFTIGKFLIGLYLGKSGLSTAYGAAGSIVVLIVWVYYSAQIVFFGAELTRVFAGRYERRLTPKEGAVFTEKQAPLG